MASRLIPCPSCARHVKVGPPSCPFCGGSVPTDVPARVVAAGRPLSRAALLFAGAASATACSSSSSTGAPQPAYGVVIMRDAGDDTGDDAGTGDATITDDGSRADTGGPTPAYGVVALDATDDLGQSSADYGVFVNPDGG